MRKLICQWFGHKWVELSLLYPQGSKVRVCTRCKTAYQLNEKNKQIKKQDTL